jgi:hypothetical protein
MAEREQYDGRHLTEMDKILLHLAAIDSLTAEDILKYRQNFEFFVENRVTLEERFNGQWVASIDQHFYGNPRLSNLHNDIEHIPNSNRAYIEQIHKGFFPTR